MFNPSLHTATNKPIGLINKPVDARTYYYDEVNFVYRPYVSNAEVLAYLTGNQRIGQFSIIINTGGSVFNGVITGGTNAEWWFKNGILDSDLIFKGASGGTQWGEIGGNIEDQTDLVDYINDAISGITVDPLVNEYETAEPLPISITDDISMYGDYPDVMVFYTDTGVEIKTATITRIPLASPTEITIDAANDGSGVTDGKLTIIIKQ